MAEPIKMPFGLRTWVGPGNHVLDGDGGGASHLQSIGALCGHLCNAKMAEPIDMLFGLWARMGPGKLCGHLRYMGPISPMERGNFEGGRGGTL